MTKFWLIAALLSASAFGGSITYNYTGHNFFTCSFGTCPANFRSDYITASVTLNNPLGLNQPLTNYLAAGNTQNLLSWTLGDHLGLFAFSSNDANSSNELNDVLTGENTLALATNGAGNISVYLMDGPVGGIIGPPIVNPPGAPPGTVIADFVEIQLNQPSEWDAYASTGGTWTQSLNGFPGGTNSAPVFFILGSPVSGVSGSIAGAGSQDYYGFYWQGGAFNASETVTGAALDAGYLFSLGTPANCRGLDSQNLNVGDNFTSTISIANLSAGTYCIGIEADNAADPNYAITFNTPVNTTPEPCTCVLLTSGLGLIALLRRRRNLSSTPISRGDKLQLNPCPPSSPS